MCSATEHPESINRYLQEELRAGRVIRLNGGDEGVSGIHVSRFGVIPKPHQPGKWRLITDLSSPKGSSVNDGVAPALCSVSYASVDDAVRCIACLGRGALLAKFDIASAYRAVPVHPEDRRLLGMKWRGNVGTPVRPEVSAQDLHSRSRCVAVGDGEAPCHTCHALSGRFPDLRSSQVGQLQACSPGQSGAVQSAGFPNCRAQGGEPIVQTFLPGYPAARSKLGRLIASWRCRKGCRKRELLSLIGQLQHACRVVRAAGQFSGR